MRLLIILTGLLFATTIYAQSNTDTTSLAYIFDDGGLSEAKNVLKINLATIIVGDVPISYERVFGNSVAIEVGIGSLLPFYNSDLSEVLFEDETLDESLTIDNPKGGRSFVIFPKFYSKQEAPLSVFYGIKYRDRRYTFESKEDVKIIDITFNSGIQYHLKGKLVMEVNYGLGFRTRQQEGSNPGQDQTNISFPLAIKTGYLF